MDRWQEFHGWMAFDRLPEGYGLRRAFTIGYRLTDMREDKWTGRFNRFKAEERNALRGGAAVMGVASRDLMEGLGWEGARTVFVPALRSGEEKASREGILWRLTKYCAKQAGTGFVGDALSKQPHQSLHSSFNADDRREILSGAKYTAGRVEGERIVIFDDLITRGATMSHIAHAIMRANRGVKVYGVALGKTERVEYNWENFGVELSNEHVPDGWDSIWRGQ